MPSFTVHSSAHKVIFNSSMAVTVLGDSGFISYIIGQFISYIIGQDEYVSYYFYLYGLKVKVNFLFRFFS